MRIAVRVLVLLVALPTLLGYLDRVSWFFELATFFRVQYAALLVLLAGAAIALRDPPTAAVGVALAVLNTATVAPHWTPRQAGDPIGTDSVRLLFTNVDAANHDRRATAAYISRIDADLVGITELTPGWRDALRPVLRRYPYRITWVEDDAYGIGLFSRRPLHGRVVRLPPDGPASIVARFTLSHRDVTLVVTHPHTPLGPHAGGLHQRQLRALAAARPEWTPRALVCGDLNTPPWSGPLRALMHRARLADSHRGYGLESSWPSWFWPLRVPIDNCLVSAGLAVTARSRGPSIGSDHFPLNVQLRATRLG